MTISEQLTERLEWWLNKYKTIWTVGVDIDREHSLLAIVAVRYLGKSKFRKRWTRCAFGTHFEPSECAQLGVEGVAAEAAKRLKANYTEYANMPHKNFNYFVKKRRRTRSMAGK